MNMKMFKTNATRSRWITRLVVIAALLAVGACRSTETAGSQLSDAALTGKVKARLAAEPQVNAFDIDVDSDHGVVRLSGTVDSEQARREAVRLTRRTEGVREVIDDLEIGEPTFKENVDDAWIGTKIKAKLTAAPDIDPFNIDVDVNRGVVTLTGKVRTSYARDHAGELARQTRGVVEVDNRIEVVGDGD